jgi:ornithine cyclodeaminase
MLETLMLGESELIRCGASDVNFVGATLEAMFVLHAKGAYTQPASVFLKRPECPHVADRIIAMPAYLGGDFGMEGMKWIASAANNPARGLPRANAVIVLNDAETRLPLCIMEGSLISAMRTAVVSGLACKYLGRKDARTVGLVGCGRIGGLTLHVIRQWYPDIKQYLIYDSSPERAAKFKAHLAKIGIPGVEICASFADALTDADFGIVSTTAEEAYVPPSCFKKGSLFLNVSLMDPTYELVKAADKILVDDWVQSVHSNRVLGRMFKAGMITEASIHATLGEVIAGKKPGRENPDERIFWNPMGMAIEDVAVASALYRKAVAAGLGTPFKLRDEEWDVLF